MGNLLIKEKTIVVPGDTVATGMDFLPASGMFREGENIICMQVGLLSVNGRLVKVIPLKGLYIPKKDDIVIGRITDVGYTNWFVDVGYANEASLSMKDASSDYIERGANLTDYFAHNDFILTKITNVTQSKSIDLTMRGPGLRKLHEGIIIKVMATKVPRIVGRQGSMISMIKEKTGCQISAGQNGLIWINDKEPKNVKLAIDTIRLIEQEAHTSGLTEKIKTFLEKGGKK
ncbi:MAG: exosome complex RNA-binding protein Rrp4 [archaeon]